MHFIHSENGSSITPASKHCWQRFELDEMALIEMRDGVLNLCGANGLFLGPTVQTLNRLESCAGWFLWHYQTTMK